MRGQRPVSIAILVTVGLLFLGGGAVGATGGARLIKDIDQTLSYQSGSYPSRFHRLGSVTFFQATIPATGTELWRTDGTEAGTWMVKDIRPGVLSGIRVAPLDLVDFGSLVLFVADDGVHGSELWKSDGTTAGTTMVKDIRPGAAGALESGGDIVWKHVVAGRFVYFAANDGDHGFELWRTDGTEAGTILLKDILPGSQSAFGMPAPQFGGSGAAPLGDSLFFIAYDGVHGFELWKSDGTPAGTTLVIDLNPGSGSASFGPMIVLDGELIFWAKASTLSGTAIWRTDGTDIGTVRVTEIFPGAIWGPRNVVVFNGYVYFDAAQYLYRTDGTTAGTQRIQTFVGAQTAFYGVIDGSLVLSAADSRGTELWVSDGEENGARVVKDINPGPGSSNPSAPQIIGGKLFFMANDGAHGGELWTTDLTEAGTHMVADITPGSDSTIAVVYGAGGVCYLQVLSAQGQGLWRTDGTQAGTRRLAKAPALAGEAAEASDGSLLFDADDGLHGAELWRTDGTDDHTALLKDINPAVITLDSNASFLGSIHVPGVGERMMMVAEDRAHGYELWVTDGTEPGTHMVKDVNPGPQSSINGGAIVFRDILYFVADDGVHGTELWRSDGTEAGTFMVSDVWPGPGSGLAPSAMVEFHDSIYFLASDGVHSGFWTTDGTGAGTALAVEVIAFSDFLVATADAFYFIGFNPAMNDATLWKSDGTAAGTSAVTHDPDSMGPLDPIRATRFGDKVFFYAFDPVNNYEPWVSDGTEAGTFMLRDINVGSGTSFAYFTPGATLGDSIYFSADDQVLGANLWKSDGTTAGTVLVKDVSPGGFSDIGSIIDQNGTLYFTAGQFTSHIVDLWKSDGTEQGTVPVLQDFAGIGSDLVPVPGGMLFTAYDSDHGYELWHSDGTAQGTGLSQDINPGGAGSSPQGYAVMGDRVFFVAADGVHGREPWFAHSAILLGKPAQGIQDLRGEVTDLGLPAGLATSLTAKLDSAARALAAGRSAGAAASLDLLTKHLAVMTPRWISSSDAEALREFAGEIEGLLAAPPTASGEPRTGRVVVTPSIQEP